MKIKLSCWITNLLKSVVVVLFFFSTPSAQTPDLRHEWTWQNPLPQGNMLYEFQFVSPYTGFIRTSGRTLLITTNAGKTWNEQIVTNTKDVFGLINSFCFVDSLNGWVTGSGAPGFVTKTKDGGKSWEKVNFPIELDDDTYHRNIFCIYFVDTLMGYICDDLGRIFRTTDGGNSWIMNRLSQSREIHSIYFYNPRNGFAIGNTQLFVTHDYGENWIADPRIIGDMSYDNKIFFADTLHGWILTKDIIYRTTDAGLTWSMSSIDSASSTRDMDATQLQFIDKLNGYIATNFGLYKTTDGGIIWKNIDKGHVFNGLYFSDCLNGFATGKSSHSDTRDNVLFSTTDGGLSWKTDSKKITEQLLFGVDFIEESTGWVTGRGGVILFTSDGGNSWEFQPSTVTEQLEAVKFLDKNNGWIVGSSGTLLKSSNSGKTWIKKPVRIYPDSSAVKTHFTSLSFIDEKEGWIAGWEYPTSFTNSGRVFHTTDAGETWNEQTPAITGIVEGICFVNRNNGWISCGGLSGTDKGEVYKTNNGGKSWELQFMDPVTPNNKLFFVDSLNGWVISQAGVIKTTDGGNSWIKKSVYPSFPASIFFIDKLNGWMGCNWGDIYYTSDGGDNWVLHNTKLLSNNIPGIDFVDVNTGWAVGGFGIILHTTNNPNSVEKHNIPFTGNCQLFQNYPNPFNPSTNIKFRLSQSGLVKVEIYDILGKKITTLLNEEKKPGEYILNFSSDDLPSGIYLYQIIFRGNIYSGKMIILK